MRLSGCISGESDESSDRPNSACGDRVRPSAELYVGDHQKSTRCIRSADPTDFIGLQAGTTWATSAAPTAAGLADEVDAIHPDTSGFVQFLVLNGGNGGEPGVGGPAQLIKVALVG